MFSIYKAPSSRSVSMIVFLLVAALLFQTLFFQRTTSAEGEAADDNSRLTSTLMEKRGISYTEASNLLTAQDNASSLFDTLQKQRLHNFTGLWIDRNDERVKIGRINNYPTSMTELNSAVSAAKMTDVVDYVTQKYSYTQLEEWAGEISSELKSVDQGKKRMDSQCRH